MHTRWIVLLAALAMVVVACDGDDAELSTSSTIITGGTNAPVTTTTTPGEGAGSDGETSSSTTLLGQPVTTFEVVARFPNDNGEERHYVIPNGAYTDVDLENFVIDLIEADPELYGGEVFDNADAADAFLVDAAERTEEQITLLERHYFVSLIGRDRIEFHGPFAEFPGGAIGS